MYGPQAQANAAACAEHALSRGTNWLCSEARPPFVVPQPIALCVMCATFSIVKFRDNTVYLLRLLLKFIIEVMGCRQNSLLKDLKYSGLKYVSFYCFP